MPTTYQRYPISTVALANAVSLCIYAGGMLIFLQLELTFAIVYSAYCLWIEFRLLRGSCVNCYYYGGRCAFGRGRLCALLFPKGSAVKVAEHKITWKHLIPDFLVLLFPLLAGLISLIRGFNLSTLVAMVVISTLSTAGNAFVRGSLACNHCVQRKMGCPAAQLFNVGAK